MPKNAFKPVGPISKPSTSGFPAHHIATQFGAVHPMGDTEGGSAERDMYQITRDQDVMAKNPFGITHGKP